MRSGLLSRLVRGQFSLRRTFWSGVLGYLACVLLFQAAVVLAGVIGVLVVLGLMLLYSVTLNVAIWNAVDRYDGVLLWGVLAILTVIGATGVILFGILDVIGLFRPSDGQLIARLL